MFVLVNVETGKQYRKPGNFCDQAYNTERGAKIALAKLKKITMSPDSWTFMTLEAYREAYPVKMVPVKNLMTGVVVMEAEDTPRCCSVGSELYWTM